jgi:hypothetical protein
VVIILLVVFGIATSITSVVVLCIAACAACGASVAGQRAEAQAVYYAMPAGPGGDVQIGGFQQQQQQQQFASVVQPVDTGGQ